MPAIDQLQVKLINQLNPVGSVGSDTVLPVMLAGATTANQATVAQIRATTAPLDSPTLTGNPKAPTPVTSSNDTSISTTAFSNALWDSKFATNKQIKQIVSASLATSQTIASTSNTSIISLAFTPTSASSILIIDCFLNGVATLGSASNYGIISFGWAGTQQSLITGTVGNTSTTPTTSDGSGVVGRFILASNHNSLGTAARTYQIFGRQNVLSGNLTINWGGGQSILSIMEIAV